MGDFVCTDESLTDEERFELKWGERLAAGRRAKAGPTKATAVAKVEDKPVPAKASGR
jgi:hypothetical protein